MQQEFVMERLSAGALYTDPGLRERNVPDAPVRKGFDRGNTAGAGIDAAARFSAAFLQIFPDPLRREAPYLVKYHLGPHIKNHIKKHIGNLMCSPGSLMRLQRIRDRKNT